jgi:hypothetical protein
MPIVGRSSHTGRAAYLATGLEVCWQNSLPQYAALSTVRREQRLRQATHVNERLTTPIVAQPHRPMAKTAERFARCAADVVFPWWATVAAENVAAEHTQIQTFDLDAVTGEDPKAAKLAES